MHSRIHYLFLLSIFTLPFYTSAGEFAGHSKFKEVRFNHPEEMHEESQWFTDYEESEMRRGNIVAGGVISTLFVGVGAAAGAGAGFFVGPLGIVAGAKAGASIGGAGGVLLCRSAIDDEYNKKIETKKEKSAPLEIIFTHSLHRPSRELYTAYQAFKRDEAPLVISRHNFNVKQYITARISATRTFPILLYTIIKSQNAPALKNLDHINLLNHTYINSGYNADMLKTFEELKKSKEASKLFGTIRELAIASKCDNSQGNEFNECLSRIIAQICACNLLATALPLVEEIDALKNSHQQTQNALINATAELEELRQDNTDNEEVLERYRNRVVRMATENRDIKELLERKQVQTEAQRENFAQQSVKAAQDFENIRSQLSPARRRAAEVSPLRRQVEEKDNEIAALKRQLEEARKNVWHPSKDEAVIKVLPNSKN